MSKHTQCNDTQAYKKNGDLYCYICKQITSTRADKAQRKAKTMSKEIKDVIDRAARLLHHECEDARYHAQQAIDSAYEGELEDAYAMLNQAYWMAAGAC